MVWCGKWSQMTERTVWVTHDAEPGACTEPECDGFGRVSEREVSVPWCTTHDSPQDTKVRGSYRPHPEFCEFGRAWGHINEPCEFVDGVVWKVLE